MVRVKRRYVTILIHPDDPKVTILPFTDYDFLNCVKEAVSGMHGDFGLGSIMKSLRVKKFSPDTRIVVLACQRGPHELLTSTLPFIRKVKTTPCSLQQIYLSGTIRSSLRFLIKKYNQEVTDFNRTLETIRTGKMKETPQTKIGKKRKATDDVEAE